MKKFIALCMIIMATLSVSAKTIKEFVVTTQPQMSCQNCENKIKKNLRFEKGVTNIQTDLENQVVVVTYDADKTNEANLTKAFEKIDYKVAPSSKGVSSTAAKSCGKSCDKAKACDKKCDKAKACDKKCDKAKACDKKCDKAKACDKKCDKAKACDKKCDKAKACGKNAEKKCTGDCKDGTCKKGEGNCKKGEANCCKNKK